MMSWTRVARVREENLIGEEVPTEVVVVVGGKDVKFRVMFANSVPELAVFFWDFLRMMMLMTVARMERRVTMTAVMRMQFVLQRKPRFAVRLTLGMKCKERV